MDVDDFAVPVPMVERRRHGGLDLHGAADDGRPRPAVVLVHGGPVAPDADPPPSEWPTYVAYASLLAEQGVIGATFTHRLHSADDAPLAADDLADAFAQVRAHPAVDADRIGVWAFSMGGVLVAAWLRDPPPWLRAIAWNYPILAPGADWEGDVPRFDCLDAVVAAPQLPLLLVRVEHELEGEVFAPAQDAFVRTARDHQCALDVLDVPDAHHPFERRDHTPDTRAAVETAVNWMALRTADETP